MREKKSSGFEATLLFLCNRKEPECSEKPRRICRANSLRIVAAERRFFYAEP